MKKLSKLIRLILAVTLSLPSLACALGFWLEAPPQQRPNPFDQHDLASLPAPAPLPPPPPPALTEIYFDQMESLPCGFYTYDDGTSSPAIPTLTQDSAQAHSGSGAYYHSYNFATSWGAGFGFSPMSCAVALVDARSIAPTKFFMWIKTDKDLGLYVTLVEDNATLGGNQEKWTSPLVAVTAGSTWQLVQVPLVAFTLNNYFHVTLGNPADNNALDPVINTVDIQYAAGALGQVANTYLDDLGFSK